MNALLNGMNDRQAEAVQTTYGGGWFWKDPSFDPPHCLSD